MVEMGKQFFYLAAIIFLVLGLQTKYLVFCK